MKKYELSKRNKIDRTFPLTSELIFSKWLHENIHRFNNRPMPYSKEEFYFQGITKAITLHLDFRQPEAILSFDDIKTGENYDHYVIQYVGNLKYNLEKGYYDTDRTDSVYKYYNTYAELIVTEVFEEIIEYCNENFKEDKSLYLINYDGYTEGFIAPSDETHITKLNKLKFKNNDNIQYLKYKLFS